MQPAHGREDDEVNNSLDAQQTSVNEKELCLKNRLVQLQAKYIVRKDE